MALISDEYRDQNRLLHKGNSGFGSSGRKNADATKALAAEYMASTVLDYGCGKRGLEAALAGSGLEVRNYDPAIDGLEADPQAADIVICGDVLEHIEPDCLDDVLKHLASKIGKIGYLVIACRHAEKNLPDGRNAHLIVQGPAWWLHKISEHMQIIKSESRPVHEEVIFWVKKHEHY
jgi:2-polyprenyl-3-methyl-5-hydroxy-6-metoxy-1,4-benzoquinol methylase